MRKIQRLAIKRRAFGAVALLLSGALLSATAAEIIIPLAVPFDVLTLGMAKQLYTEQGEIAPVWHESDCRYLYLDHPQFGRQGEFLRFVSHGAGNAGATVFGRCLGPIAWRGFVEVLATPSIGADWQLRLHVDRSTLYGEDWKKGLLAGPIWNAAQRFVPPALAEFRVDLAPPRDELLSLVRASVSPADAAQLDAVLRSATAKAVKIDDRGMIVDLALTVPDSALQQRPPPTELEAPLGTAELEAVEAALQRWDAFLVFVIKELAADIVDPTIREQLLELLLASRYEVLPILAGEAGKSAGDPVRALFVETWQGLLEIIQEAQRRGVELDKVTRYAAFIRAGDVLLAIDRATPGLGLEISADGLRRLARMLQPEALEDPLKYSLEPDTALRALLGFPPALPEEAPLETLPEEGPQSRFGKGRMVHAAEDNRDGDIGALRKRLDRWVPEDAEIGEYRSAMDRLLRMTTEREVQDAALETRHQPLFRHLVRATALKESCWRQFVRKGNKITYLLSSAGSIGLMQINRYVWRGFYNLEQVKWNVAYNAEAGAEILLHYLLRYAAGEEKTGSTDNVARATYAVYNAGPGAVGRYRGKRGSRREQDIHRRFWEMYQGFAADGEADLFRCTVEPGRPAEATARVKSSPGESPQKRWPASTRGFFAVFRLSAADGLRVPSTRRLRMSVNPMKPKIISR